MKFTISEQPPEPGEAYRGNIPLVVGVMATQFADTRGVNGDQYGEAVQTTKDVLNWALEGAELPEDRVARREFAAAVLAANQEPQLEQGVSNE